MHKKDDFFSYMSEVYPEVELISKYSGYYNPVLIENKYGKCELTPQMLINGIKPSICNSVDKTEYMIGRFKEVHGDKYDYSRFRYVKMNEPILIGCPKHGFFTTTSKSHLRIKGGCCKCMESYEESFIRNVISKFDIIYGSCYDYSDVFFSGENGRILVKCNTCGHKFLVKINEHLGGKGCPRCFKRNNTGSIGRYSSISAEANKEVWLNIPAIVYFIKCWNENEEFFKIGITTRGVNIRFSGFEYCWESVREINTNLYNAVYLEQHFHEQHKKFKYTPKIKFDGHTECFSKLI